jgi:lipoyl(octanoyl) transferase
MLFQIKKVGKIAYNAALDLQEKTRTDVAQGSADTLIFCEHPHLYTFGKSAIKSNLLINQNFLKTINAEVYETERGGDITYHGPGQLVGYPIINLRKHGVGVKKYVETLETALIETLAHYNVQAYQIEGLTGIWVGIANETKRKIGAIGIRVKDGVSMHGFALNINTDLSYFQHIIPCGLSDSLVTSLEQEGCPASLVEFEAQFVICFQKEWQNTLDL